MDVLSNLKFKNSGPSLESYTDFPTTPIQGQMILVNGVVFIYTTLSGMSTWYPLSNESSYFVHAQGLVSTSWNVVHNLDTTDFIFFVYDENNNLMQPQFEPIDNNSFNVNFASARKGKVVVFVAAQRYAPRVSTSNLITTNIYNEPTGTLAFKFLPNGDIQFNGNLVPGITETFSIGSPTSKIKDLYVSANTIYLGDATTIEGNSITVQAKENATNINDSASLTANNLIVKSFTYLDEGVSTDVDASITFKSKNNQDYKLSLKDISGVNTFDFGTTPISGSLSGNALTATKFLNPVKINGIDFDGSQDVNVSNNISISDITDVINTAPNKPILISTDKISIIDSEDNLALKNISYDQFKTELKEYFDTVYTGGGTGPVIGTSDSPVISGVNIGNETQTIILTVDNYDSSSIYTFDVTGGSFSRAAGVVTWILPQVADSEAHRLTVTVTNPGKTPTSVFHPVNVFNINTTMDSMVLYEDTSMSEFTNLNNISIVNNKLLATMDSTLNIFNNKVIAIVGMESGDKILVDGVTYEVLETTLGIDGSANSSMVNSVSLATSDITPEGTIIYDSQVDNAAYLAFDRNNSAGWRTNKITGLWIGFRYNSARIINKYNIAGLTTAASVAPKDWKFQASNDGTTWIDLSTVTNQINWAVSELRSYSCINGTPYTHYRVYITDGNGSADIGLASLELIEASNLVSSTLPVLPQFITSAKLLTKFAESNTITQDSYETDFTGITGLEVIYEQYNLISTNSTTSIIQTLMVNIGDIVVFGNSTDGVKSLTVSSSNYSAGNLDISSLGFTVVPSYGYRKDASLQVNIGNNPFVTDNRVDEVLTNDIYNSDGIYNTSTTNKVPILTGVTALLTSTTTQSGAEAWRIFDGNLTTPGMFIVSAGTPGRITYDFSSPVIINKYGINTLYTSGQPNPSSWTIQGSNDNITYDVLDTRTSISWTSTPETKWFTFNTGSAYRYYRMVITAPISASVRISELYLVENISPKMTIKANYSDIITGNSARTIKFRVKLNKITDSVQKISAVLQKL